MRNRLHELSGIRPVLVIFIILALNTTAWADEEVHGRLSEYQGLTVLELWGTPEQAGYAHGYLLAGRIVHFMENYLLSEKVFPQIAMYKTILLPAVRRQFVWGETRQREMLALCRGIRDKVGPDGFYSAKLGRQFKVDDLMVANALADWHAMMCSTFSAWGSLTKDGQTLTARNLDFGFTGEMEKAQIVIVYRGDGQHHPWMGVTWLGTIGVYTAMNDEGVTIMMHDSNGLPASYNDGFTPRSLVLCEALESASATTFVEDIKRVFQLRRVMVGNNIHASAPHQAGKPPAAVFEYDANEHEQGVTVRLPQHNHSQLTDALCCTNHMSLRKKPIKTRTGRRARLTKRLTDMAAKGEQLDAADAMKLIHEVRWEMPTLHSVVFEPARRIMHVHIPIFGDRIVEFRLDDWLKRPIEPTGDSKATLLPRKEQP